MRWHTVTDGSGSEGGNWQMQWVASTLHTTSEHALSSISTVDAHTWAASSRLNYRPPADLNGISVWLQRRNVVSARVPSHFKRSLLLRSAWRWGEAVSASALLSADSWFDVRRDLPTPRLKAQFSLESRSVHPATDTASHFKGIPLPLADHYGITELQNYHISNLTSMSNVPVSLCVTQRQRGK